MKSELNRTILQSSLITILVVCGLAPLARAQAPKAGPFKSSSIQVEQIQSDDVKLPAEFQMALYENVVEQVGKTKRFQHVYRDGDTNAANAPDLITLHCTVTGFKQGSARARQVTTVAGATSIAVHVRFTDKDGKTLYENDAKGQVRFLGENLRATFNFAKKVASIVRQNFAASSSTST